MTDDAITAERILETAEEVVRRHGPTKATVVDVARALGVSHGNVYRFFPSKAALRAAVTARWLQRISAPLTAVAASGGPAATRLRRWFDELVALKRKKVLADPELFAAYSALTRESGEVVQAHVGELIRQVAGIIADGVAAGEFTVDDPAVAARAMVEATARFHNPVHAASWSEPGVDDAWRAVFELLLRGLTSRYPPSAATARASRRRSTPR